MRQTNEDDIFRITLECHLGGGFKHFFMFNPTWGNDPIWLIFFRWVETTNSPTSHLSRTYNNFHKPPALYVSWPSTKTKTWPGWNRMCRSSWHFWESIITISPTPRMSSIASEHSKPQLVHQTQGLLEDVQVCSYEFVHSQIVPHSFLCCFFVV